MTATDRKRSAIIRLVCEQHALGVRASSLAHSVRVAAHCQGVSSAQAAQWVREYFASDGSLCQNGEIL